MISIEINRQQLQELTDAIRRSRKDLAKEVAAAINATAKQTQLNMGREIRSVVNMKKATAEKAIKQRRTASAGSLQAVVSLSKEERAGFGLQHFGAKQDKRGVSYKISKQGGRKRINGAFMGPRPGEFAPRLHGGVFKRVTKKRLPIVKLYGVSPFGAYVKNNFEDAEVVFVAKSLKTQIERRINLNVLRANGLVPK